MSDAVFSWDSEIVNDDSFITFEEGDYLFKVTGFEKGSYNGSAKLPACPQAELEIEISNDAGQTVTVKETLKLCQKMEWKLSEFFRAIGQKKHGEKLRMDWGKVVGSVGIAHVTKDEDSKKPGNFYNHIGKYLDYDPEMIAKYQQAQGGGTYQQETMGGTGWGGNWN